MTSEETTTPAKRIGEGEHFALILKGGSTKGLAYLGALAALYKYKRVPYAIAGSSAGALTAFFLACVHAGVTKDREKAREKLGAELQKLANMEPAAKFFDLRFFRSFFLGFRLLRRGYLASGEGLKDWMYEQLKEAGVLESEIKTMTVGELERRSGLSLLFAVSSVRQGVYFAERDSLVIDAVRGSAALPLALEPVRIATKSPVSTAASESFATRIKRYLSLKCKPKQVAKDEFDDTWIDGGLLQNLPIPLYEQAREREEQSQERKKDELEMPQRYLALHLDSASVPKASGFLSIFGPEILGLLLFVSAYLVLQIPEVSIIQSRGTFYHAGFMAIIALLVMVLMLGAALVLRRLIAIPLRVGVFQTAGYVLRAVDAQNEESVLEKAKKENMLICIETGSTIATSTLFLTKSQRRLLILSGAASALEYVGHSEASIELPLPDGLAMPGRQEKGCNPKEELDEKFMASVRGSSLKMGVYLALGALPVVLIALLLMVSVSGLLYRRQHQIGGPNDNKKPIVLDLTRFIRKPYGPCASRVGSERCYTYAEQLVKSVTNGTDIADCFNSTAGTLSTDQVHTLCWIHFCVAEDGGVGECSDPLSHVVDCQDRARRGLTGDAAIACLNALALQPQGWLTPRSF